MCEENNIAAAAEKNNIFHTEELNLYIIATTRLFIKSLVIDNIINPLLLVENSNINKKSVIYIITFALLLLASSYMNK